ncbi:MAG: DUF1926 domain-containing protein [Treponema sp.]|jgi:hypothetical protein|nr:DUF1926 domain-containing protein [Treponema sp.]
MSRNISLILGSHEHLPHGAGIDEFEELYRIRLKPFISTLYRYPAIPAVLHYSGVLLNWLERNHPEFFLILEDMISRKQVELLGGGFYEPMMALLSPQDRISQIEMFTTYLRKQFGRRPQGCWLPGLAWEQAMVGTLNSCGMVYTFLEDKAFRSAGLGEDLPVISEDQGKLVTIFPLAGKFREAFAGERALPVLERLRDRSGGVTAVFPARFCGDEENPELGIHQFFEDLSLAGSFINFTSPSRYLKNAKPLSKAYFPASPVLGCGYGPAAGEEELRRPGLLPRQFLVVYPEANGVYSKMIFTHSLINQLRGDKSRKRTALEELLKAQSFDVFCCLGDGGVYRNTLRKAAYRALLGAEKITREKDIFTPSLLTFDFDLDGEEEYLFQDTHVNCYIKTRGAGIFELDYLPKNWNYLDTMARRREPDQGEEQPADCYRRGAFLDRLVSPSLSLEDARAGRFEGSRFCALETFEPVLVDRAHEKVRFRLAPRNPASGGGAAGLLFPEESVEPEASLPSGAFDGAGLEKTYHLSGNVLTVYYTLTNGGGLPLECTLIPEIDLSFFDEGEAFFRVLALRNGVKENAGGDEIAAVEGLEFLDIKNEDIVSLTMNRSCDVWLIPIKTRSRIRGRIADQYQSTCIMPRFPLSLEPGASWNAEFKLKIYH